MPVTSIRFRALALTATATAVACAAAVATPAAAASSVHFLSKSQFPQGDRWENWHQTAIKNGLQDPSHLCVEQILPESRTTYRAFYTDLDAGGVQYVVKAKDTAAAKKLVTRIKDRLPVCGERAADEMPEGEFHIVKYSHQDVEDGLSLRGLFTTGDGVESGTTLYGIGRDGRYVTVVELDQIGEKSGAPITKFTKTARTGLQQLRD